MAVLYIRLLNKTSENKISDAQKRNAAILDVFEDVSECCLMPQKMLLVYQRDCFQFVHEFFVCHHLVLSTSCLLYFVKCSFE